MRRLLVLMVSVFITTSAYSNQKLLTFNMGVGAGGGSASAYSGTTLGTSLGNSTLYNDPSINIKTSFNMGAGYDYFLGDVVAFTTGLYYAYKPFSVTYPRKTATTDLKIDLGFSFIEIPFGLHFYFGGFYAGGGFYYAIIAGHSASVSSGTTNVNFKLDSVHSPLGLFIDLGYNFSLNDTTIFCINGKYKRDLSKVYDSPDMLTNIMLSDLSINIGIGFKFN